MDARTRWAVWTVSAAVPLIAMEAYALREPLTPDKPSETLSAVTQWAVGINPKAPRRWVLGPLFAVFWLWWIGHVLFLWGPNDLPRRKPRSH